LSNKLKIHFTCHLSIIKYADFHLWKCKITKWFCDIYKSRICNHICNLQSHKTRLRNAKLNKCCSTPILEGYSWWNLLDSKWYDDLTVKVLSFLIITIHACQLTNCSSNFRFKCYVWRASYKGYLSWNVTR